MSRRVEVTTGSRLHFGMMSFGTPGVRQFGGVGAMVDGPGVRLRITAAESLLVTGEQAMAARRYAEAVAQADWFTHTPNCRIDVLTTVPAHVGLGSGTQLALAIAAGLNAFFDCQPPTTEQLAHAVGRGRRSAIGMYGFLYGGLIVEAGKFDDCQMSPLISRVSIPCDWRFLLVRPENRQGISGETERQAFEKLPPVPTETTAAMCQEALLGMLPAALQGDPAGFSESLYRFGQQAGNCYAQWQGGTYASGELTKIVAELRRQGVAGVAQSSWGPTVFAVTESPGQAEDVLARFRRTAAGHRALCEIVHPRNHGATIVVYTD